MHLRETGRGGLPRSPNQQLPTGIGRVATDACFFHLPNERPVGPAPVNSSRSSLTSQKKGAGTSIARPSPDRGAPNPMSARRPYYWVVEELWFG